MKQFIALLILTASLAFGSQTVTAQANQAWYNGNRMQLTVPAVKVPTTFRFPSFDYETLTHSSTMSLTVDQFMTYAKFDTIQSASSITINPTAGLTAGALLWLQAGGFSDSARTLYVLQGATPIDTVTVGNHKIKRGYVYDGTLFQAWPK